MSCYNCSYDCNLGGFALSRYYVHIAPETRKVMAILEQEKVETYAKAHEFFVKPNGFIVPKYKQRITEIQYKCCSVKTGTPGRFSFGHKTLVAPEDALWYIWREKCLPVEELYHISKTFKAFSLEYNWAAHPYKLYRLWGCNVDAKNDIYSVLLFSVYDNVYDAHGVGSPDNPKFARKNFIKSSIA